MEALAIAYAARNITLDEWLAAREPIEQRLLGARDALARVGALAAIGDESRELRERWDELTITHKHAIAASVIDHIIVGAGRSGICEFDPTRVAIVWRF